MIKNLEKDNDLKDRLRKFIHKYRKRKQCLHLKIRNLGRGYF